VLFSTLCRPTTPPTPPPAAIQTTNKSLWLVGAFSYRLPPNNTTYELFRLVACLLVPCCSTTPPTLPSAAIQHHLRVVSTCSVFTVSLPINNSMNKLFWLVLAFFGPSAPHPNHQQVVKTFWCVFRPSATYRNWRRILRHWTSFNLKKMTELIVCLFVQSCFSFICSRHPGSFPMPYFHHIYFGPPNLTLLS
jgi:hypothetical protein